MPFKIERNDLTRMRVDAIVNAANETLLGGGGVDGCIHRAAGPLLLEECRALGGCKTGEAKLTKGYDLPCKYIIHTVGPVWRGGAHHEAELLAACYRNALALAAQHGCKSVAFPLISAGAYGYPAQDALRVATDAITGFPQIADLEVTLVIFDRSAYHIASGLYQDIRRFIDDIYVDEHAILRRLSQFPPENAARYGECGALPDDEALADAYSAVLTELPSDNAPPDERTYSAPKANRPVPRFAKGVLPSSLRRMLERIDDGFTDMLLRKIDESGMTDAECYKRANIDRKLFSKIRSNRHYQPSKSTALAFAIALRLPLDETKELLMKAGYALSRSSKLDVIVEYCIRKGIWNIHEVNEILFQFDQSLLGFRA